jgi:nicotinamide-nucleotide amidase
MSSSATPTIAAAELLAIGAELLVGETRDTNSGDLARELTELGVAVTRMTQLPDDRVVIEAAIREALSRVDLVVTTGGLGPTPDDLTREGIADALDEEPSVDPGLESWLRDLWRARGLPFVEANLKQAWLIPSAAAMDNPHGSAPGWWVEDAGHVIIALPGPPRELHPMWRDQALPRLRARGLGVDRASETLRLTGIGESMLVDLIGSDLLEAENPRMATYARADSVDVRISARGIDGRSARELVEAVVASLSPRLDPYVFARGADGWDVALADRLGHRRAASTEVGTAGYLGLLEGSAGWLVAAHQLRADDRAADVLATEARTAAGTEVGLAVVVHDHPADPRAEIGVDVEGDARRSSVTLFRGGDAGRRRAANAALAELWRRLG